MCICPRVGQCPVLKIQGQALLALLLTPLRTPCAVAIASTTWAVLLRESRVVFTFAGLDVDTKYLLLCLAICCWGIAKGGGNVVDSSLADSVPTGMRPCHAHDRVNNIPYVPTSSSPRWHLTDQSQHDAVEGGVPRPVTPSAVKLCMQGWLLRPTADEASIVMLTHRSGSRSAVYTKLWSAAALANGVGPLMATIVFVATGNVWTRHALEVQPCGLLLPPSAAL